MRLFHFSDDPGIAVFVPRPVRVPSQRPPGRAWLNGALVWAVDEIHQPMYLFPRECPRILLWPTPQTRREDRETWWQGSPARMLAYVEAAWLERIAAARLYRYEFSGAPFEDLHDAGMWVSRTEVRPVGMELIAGLPWHLESLGVELRALDSLAPLKDVWQSSLHASGIRLRNATGWTAQKP